MFCLLSYLVWWWYTPTAGVARGGNNVDVGKQALLETTNMCYGSALFIFATILFLRTITNVAIPHPANRTGEVIIMTHYPLIPLILSSSVFFLLHQLLVLN